MPTKIEWADITINPVVGCSHTGKSPWEYFWRLGKKPKRVFVGSMTDLFHENSDPRDLAHIMHGIHDHPEHTFLFLTKRPLLMRERLSVWLKNDLPLPNLWLGVTVCNQEEADAKIPLLLQTPAAKRFVSVEPMLGPIALQEYYLREHCLVCKGTDRDYTGCYSQTEGHFCCNDGCDCTAYPWDTHWMRALDWVICGGETGPRARPMHPDWVRSLRDQCTEAGVSFFFKGWGDWVTENQAPEDIILPGESRIPKGWKGRKYEAGVYRVGTRRAGRLLDGRTWDEFPEVKA